MEEEVLNRMKARGFKVNRQAEYTFGYRIKNRGRCTNEVKPLSLKAIRMMVFNKMIIK